MSTLFIADLHLEDARPDSTDQFLRFLDAEARGASRLYILGDLFEAWVGDDDPSDTGARVADALAGLADTGTQVAFIHGNRDFLLGSYFAEYSGATLLPDPFVLSLPTWQFVLSHGDGLCTDDAEYQAFRAQVRNKGWQDVFLRKPLAERKAIAAAMREQSEASKREKPMQTMDLISVSTDDFLRQYGYATLIHGHTHRPAQHDHIVDGIHVERWVLSDWHKDRGEYLAWDGHHLSRHELR